MAFRNFWRSCVREAMICSSSWLFGCFVGGWVEDRWFRYVFLRKIYISKPIGSHVWSIYIYVYIYIYERRLLFKLIWKAAFVWVTPYLVQLTFSLEACYWKNGDLVFQRWSFFSILERCMGIDDPYVKKPRWRRNWNAISKIRKTD